MQESSCPQACRFWSHSVPCGLCWRQQFGRLLRDVERRSCSIRRPLSRSRRSRRLNQRASLHVEVGSSFANRDCIIRDSFCVAFGNGGRGSYARATVFGRAATKEAATSISSLGGAILRRRPNSNACCAVNLCPVLNISSARARPINRVSRCVPPQPVRMPSAPPGCAKTASGVAIRA